MKTNIVIKKVWKDDFSAEFNVKFKSEINGEDFIVSGNYYLSGDKVFKDLSAILEKGEGSVIFQGFDNNYCKLTINKNSRGLRNITYHLNGKEQFNDITNELTIVVNTGFIIVPQANFVKLILSWTLASDGTMLYPHILFFLM